MAGRRYGGNHRFLSCRCYRHTLENLQEAAAGEHEEWSLDYPKFADIADEEGFPEIALMYRNIAIAEKGHEERYRAFIQNIETASVFAKEGEVV